MLVLATAACGSTGTGGTSAGATAGSGGATASSGGEGTSATTAATSGGEGTSATMAATEATAAETAMTGATAAETTTAEATTAGATTAETTSTTTAATETTSSATMAATETTSAGTTATAAGAATGAMGDGSTIKVGSKDFTEAVIMGEMYAQLLEANNFKVERKLRLGAEQIAQQALLNKEIDLYPEYTSTGLLTILKLPKIQDPRQIYETVKSEYEKRFQLTWLKPSPFNDTNGLAMTKKRSDELGIKTYSDLAQKAGDLIIAGPPEFYSREDGLPALQKEYGGFKFKATRQLVAGLRFPALQNGNVDVIRAFSTEGELASPDLVLLKDDKGLYPIYQVAPVVRMDTLQAHPQIAEILNKLSLPALDEKTISGLNFQVDGPDKKEPAAVAKAFLMQQGLIK